MLEELLPAAVAVAEAFGDVPDALFPEEAAAIAGASDRRRREFASARSCAHTALRRLGLPAAPIVPGPR
ncbi:MAG: 4'-phosphopantetheinyl transferase, partial [Streptosporangiaceae bacterium]